MNEIADIFRVRKSETLEDYFRNFLKVVLVWCPIVTLLFIFGFGEFDHLGLRFSISMIIATTVSTFCFTGSGLLRYFYNLYRQKKGWEKRRYHNLLNVMDSLPFLLPGLYFGFLLAGKFNLALGHKDFSPQFRDYSSGIVYGIMISGLFTLAEVLRESKAAKQAAEIKFQALENEKLKAQVSALSAQMNPHLLFNSLNTIASTITTDPNSAEDMIVKLSELYRGILKSAKGDMHSLENELTLCKSYLEIEHKRFGPRIEYDILIEESIDPAKVKIPVLLLQPLVENAVKHGLSPKREGGTVTVDVRATDAHLQILVIDNGVGIDLTRPSSGSGTALSNCRSRIQLKYGENSDFHFARNDQNKTVAKIQIPIQAAFYD